MTPPDGFAPHFRKSPLTDPWEPLFFKRTDGAIIPGLTADSQHCNSRGFIHGGLISALVDRDVCALTGATFRVAKGKRIQISG